MKDKTSDKKPGSTELDDKALDGVVGGCIPGGPSPITIKGTGGTGGWNGTHCRGRRWHHQGAFCAN